MPIYSYIRTHTPGPNGHGTRLNVPEDVEARSTLAVMDGRHYVYVDTALDLAAQDAAADVREETVTEELRDRLTRAGAVLTQKQLLRERIEGEVGDLHDLMADAMRLIEFAMMLSTRMANESLNGTQMDPATRDAYAQRVADFCAAADAGAITLRGDIEAPDAVMA